MQLKNLKDEGGCLGLLSVLVGFVVLVGIVVLVFLHFGDLLLYSSLQSCKRF